MRWDVGGPAAFTKQLRRYVSTHVAGNGQNDHKDTHQSSSYHRVAVVWSSLVQRPFFLNPELNPGLVWALWPNCKPLWGQVWSIFHTKPWTRHQTANCRCVNFAALLLHDDSCYNFLSLAYITQTCWTAQFLSFSFPSYSHNDLDLLYDTDLVLSHVWYESPVTACMIQSCWVSFVRYQSSWATTTTSMSTRGFTIPIYLVMSTTDSLHQSAVVFKLY